ncbi:transposase domain-containing protein [Streptomyces sp. ALI-76-A]|uniref:transposase domain-containing protein n=1 Tax=Streptomyces sp. ALI-76-A TaxID=3025736 RepID=UPI00256F1373|nr:transposase domain-containing protein [Streptomyces sp. ALI-76-A]MDL5206528.1 transposase domain-containing protein [Streptomyces sp. ALI-76-A]
MPGHCVLPSPLATITRTVTVAASRFAPGHLGELTPVVPFELVDAVLSETRTVQRRLRDLPSRVGVYFLLATCMFPEVGYRLVWAKLTAGLSGIPVVHPSTKALRDLRRRLGSAPVRALFEVLAGPLARPTMPGVRFGPYRTVSFDGGSSIKVPDSERNRGWLGRCPHGGYPQVELMTLVETGTRAVIAAVFGPTREGETSYATRLLHHLGPELLVLWDRGFDSNDFLTAVHATGAQVLGRIRQRRRPPVLQTLADSSYLSVIGGVPVRIIEALRPPTTPRRRAQCCPLTSGGSARAQSPTAAGSAGPAPCAPAPATRTSPAGFPGLGAGDGLPRPGQGAGRRRPCRGGSQLKASVMQSTRQSQAS